MRLSEARPARWINLFLVGAIACILSLVLVIVPGSPASSVAWTVKWRDASSTLGKWYQWQSSLTYTALRTDVYATQYGAYAAGGGYNASAAETVTLFIPSQVVLAKCKGDFPFFGDMHLKCYAGLR